MTIFNLNYSSYPFSRVLSLNALPLIPCEGVCFEAYKGPRHWLNHLFRTHHLQGLVAILTSFSNAPGVPCVYPCCQTHRGGAEQSFHPAIASSCLNTSLHPPHRCSRSLFLAAPQACDYSLMLALGNKDGVG